VQLLALIEVLKQQVASELKSIARLKLMYALLTESS
jgi:hypothetical protein